MNNFPKEPICALATGNVSGAIAVIRVSGTDVLNLIAPLFGKNLGDVSSHSLHFGNWKDKNGDLIDEVLLSYFEAGKSYTNEESIEISCHASPYVVDKILESLIDAGISMADAGEFTMRAYLNGKLDLSQAEAVADLIAAQSEKAHRVSFNQLKGGLSSELRELREKLIHFASMVELELDFAEEDVEFADRKELQKLLINVIAYVDKLINSFKFGNALKKGIPIALVGRPNAGKSTVLNAILDEERAIVSSIPGTTRDTIEEIFTYKGVQFRFIDTAGIRESNDLIESEGIKRSIDKINKADLVIYLFDSKETDLMEVRGDVQKYLQLREYLVIGTKKDQISSALLQELKQESEIDDIVYVNDYDDKERLMNLIYSKAIGTAWDEHTTIITNARHLEKLQKASESLLQALNALKNQTSGDFVAMDIRQAMYQIGQITGDISTDDLLGNIFSKFCIGK